MSKQTPTPEPAIEDDGFITVFPPPEQFCVAAEGAGRDAASPCLGPRSNSTDIAQHTLSFSLSAPKPDAPNSPRHDDSSPHLAGGPFEGIEAVVQAITWLFFAMIVFVLVYAGAETWEALSTHLDPVGNKQEKNQ